MGGSPSFKANYSKFYLNTLPHLTAGCSTTFQYRSKLSKRNGRCLKCVLSCARATTTHDLRHSSGRYPTVSATTPGLNLADVLCVSSPGINVNRRHLTLIRWKPCRPQEVSWSDLSLKKLPNCWLPWLHFAKNACPNCNTRLVPKQLVIGAVLKKHLHALLHRLLPDHHLPRILVI